MIGSLGALDPMRTFAGIRCPTLLVHSELDPVPVEWAHTLVDTIPGADFVLLEGAGHFAHIEDADRLARAVVPWLIDRAKGARLDLRNRRIPSSKETVMSTHTTAPATTEQVDALAGRIFLAGLEAIELYTVHLGVRLGLYRALDDGGPQNATELAARTALDRRYVREWLQSQALSGFVSIDGNDVDDDRFALAPGVRETLIDEVGPAFVGAIAAILPAVGGVMPDLVASFRSGDRVPVQLLPGRRRGAGGDEPPGLREPARDRLAAPDPGRDRPSPAGERPARVGRLLLRPRMVLDPAGRGVPAHHGGRLRQRCRIPAQGRRNAADRGVSDRVRFENVDLTADDPDARAATTSPSCSRPCTTCPIRRQRWPTSGGCSGPARR